MCCRLLLRSQATGWRAGSQGLRGWPWRWPSSLCFAFIVARLCGALRCRPSRWPTCCLPGNPPSSIGAAAVECGRGARRPCREACDGQEMSSAAAFTSGKTHRDENFPVASKLVRPELRPAILAFYRFARAADDVADHPTATVENKLGQLDAMEAGLRGEFGASEEGEALRRVLQERSLEDRHPLDLLEAFRRDVAKRRYADW